MGIYTSVPKEVINNYFNATRQDILIFLKRQPGKAYTAKQIALACDYPTKGTQVEVRKAITELITLDKIPIISTGNGFMFPTDPQQIIRYIHSLEERKQGIQRRITNLKSILNEILLVR